MPDTEPEAKTDGPIVDPRVRLAEWANSSDEWVRLLVAEVLASGRPVPQGVVDEAYQLFRQEKALDERTFSLVEKLSTTAKQDESAPPLTLVRLSEVYGVNALVPGAVIEPHEGLTILYGENGTGKTGYSRIFKALAESRTADEILGNINAETEEVQSAKLEYKLGPQAAVLDWTGERGVSPFTRMSIFDSPAVSTHVDDDLDYVYVPAVLALFNHVIAAIQAVSSRVDADVTSLATNNGALLSRFQNGSSIYPLIQTLGASTDLADLKAKASTDPKVDEQIDVLSQAVAALRSNTLGTQVTARRRDQRVLDESLSVAETLFAFDVNGYNDTLTRRAQLLVDYGAFRNELFAAADLPAEPDETWNAFVEAGDQYREHLLALDAHDADRCLYCRQQLTGPARDLITKYSTYLEDKISTDIQEADVAVQVAQRTIGAIPHSESASFLAGSEAEEDRPAFYSYVKTVDDVRALVTQAVGARENVGLDLSTELAAVKANLALAASQAATDVAALEEQSQNRAHALSEQQRQLTELTAAVELAKSWSMIETQVKNAKEADRLRSLKRAFSGMSRTVTALAKDASDQLVNQSFDALFIEECEALRAPVLKLQFVGREGRAQRRKMLSGRYKPSKVLSEGEQKVLALADFLAEARLAGITAPVIFDDPVSSLDHRRLREVAERVSRLADTSQVIVFTHDIWFATSLLALSEKSKRCSYFQVTDEDGKGKVTRATGPRWDTLSSIRGEINRTIQAAKASEGEARVALVRTGYDWIRSWCEVFTEQELLRGVTQRYQPNVGMTRLANINTEKLGELIPAVTKIFEDACRYIDGHSQPLATLGVSPTLSGLESDWKNLQDLKKANDESQSTTT